MLFPGCGEVHEDSRIVGGEEVDPHSIPWQVHVVICDSWGCGGCGGTIICEKFVLTAAHCMENMETGEKYSASGITVYAAEHDVDFDKDWDPKTGPKETTMERTKYELYSGEIDFSV